MMQNSNDIKTCAYKFHDRSELETDKCSRPIWEDGGPEEKFCLFHSEQYEIKTEAFNREIDLFKEGIPTEYLLRGKKEDIVIYDFRGLRFPQECSDFRNHEFDKDVMFDKAIFKGKADFFRSTFGGRAWFDRVKFSYFADFTGATFSSLTSFFGATFSKHTSFNSATFNGEAYFFEVLSINAEISFDFAVFKRNITIDTFPVKEHLPASLSFGNTQVTGDFFLADSEICRISAYNLNYSGGFTLRNIAFRNDNLNLPSVLGDLCLERANFINIDLSTVALGGTFIREVAFDRISFGKPTTWGWRWSSRLLGRPNEAIYEERYARYGGRNDKKDEFCAAETVYRTLKHEMEKQHARGLARRMRAGELECKLHGDSNLFEKILLFVYRFFNGFGLRWIRALVFWLISILIFGLIYMDQTAVYKINDEEKQAYINEEVSLNLEQAVRHSVETSLAVLPTKYNLDNTSIDYIEGLQRLICPLLLAAFILAVRNTATD